MLVHWGGISGADCTHLCTFDIPMISNIPNLIYLAPTNKEEYMNMLEWSVEQIDYPVAIRVPQGELKTTGIKDNTDYSKINKFKLISKGEKVAILGLGNMFELAENTAKEIEKELDFKPTLINPIYITGIDKELLDNLKSDHKLVITLEDGVLNGGFGEKIARYYGDSDMKVLCRGAEKEFTDRIPANVLYEKYGLTAKMLLNDVKRCI